MSLANFAPIETLDTVSLEELDRADRDLRHWQWPAAGKIPLGSDEHKRMFCHALLDTHHPYKPAIIAWPHLNKEELARVTRLPIWDLAVQTEGHAGLRMKMFGESVIDPLLRDAILMNADEETRHKQVLHHMVSAYGVRLNPEPIYYAPEDREWGFLITGFSECIDSFFAFGLFELAKRSGLFPAPLVETFEPVIQEECRHILFFTNWLIWYRHTLSPLQLIRHWIKCFGIFARIIKERLQTADDLDAGDNFTATGHKSMGIDVSVSALLALCIDEDNRRFAGYDRRLARPRFMPGIAKFAITVLKLMGLCERSLASVAKNILPGNDSSSASRIFSNDLQQLDFDSKI